MTSALEEYGQLTTEFLDTLALIPGNKRNVSPAGEWSPAFVVHHMADGELHFAARYFCTLGSDTPPMILFDEDRYPEALHYEQRSVAKSMAAIAGIRAMAHEVLATLDADAWERTTTTLEGESYTLTALVEKANSHMKAHTEQLKELSMTI